MIVSRYARDRIAKYGNRKSLFGGKLYASTAERDYAVELAARQHAGEIRDLEEQPVVRLADAVNYKPDFRYVERPSGRVIYAEVKGFEDARWRVIKQLWRVHGPATLQVIKRAGRRQRFEIVKEILPQR